LVDRRKQYRERIQKGLCADNLSCDNIPEKGKSRCAFHARLNCDKNKSYQKRKKDKGLCLYGGCKTPVGTSVFCKTHKKITNEKTNVLELKTKIEVMSVYCGGKPRCQCRGCKVTFIGFLQMDHVMGGGINHKHEKGYVLRGTHLFVWLKRHKYPKGFQVLCANCNGPGGKGRNKKCPLEGKHHV